MNSGPEDRIPKALAKRVARVQRMIDGQIIREIAGQFPTREGKDEKTRIEIRAYVIRRLRIEQSLGNVDLAGVAIRVGVAGADAYIPEGALVVKAEGIKSVGSPKKRSSILWTPPSYDD